MDISTGLGLLAGAIVLCMLILLGGDLRMFLDLHAFIVIFGARFPPVIRFPLNSIFHGLPLGAKFAFTLRRMSQRDLVDEIAGLAEIARKSGPVGLEKVEIDDPFLAKGIRFVADGYDGISSATISSATPTTSSPISTKARRSIAPSAIAHRPSA